MESGFTTIQPKDATAPIDPSLKVTRWMSKTVYSVHPDSKLIDAVEIMMEHRIRHVPVLDGDRLVGIISDRDVRNTLPRKNEMQQLPEISCRGSLNRRASVAMTRYPITIPVDFSIHEAAEIMCREKIGALPVMDVGRMVGILSAEDLLWALTQLTAPRP